MLYAGIYVENSERKEVCEKLIPGNKEDGGDVFGSSFIKKSSSRKNREMAVKARNCSCHIGKTTTNTTYNVGSATTLHFTDV